MPCVPRYKKTKNLADFDSSVVCSGVNAVCVAGDALHVSLVLGGVGHPELDSVRLHGQISKPKIYKILALKYSYSAASASHSLFLSRRC